MDEHSEQKIPKVLDLFSSKPVNVAFQNTSVVEYNPVSTALNLVKFEINTGLSYCDLRHCYLQTSFKLRKRETAKDQDGKDYYKLSVVTAADNVSLANGFGATAIKNLKVLFNNRQIFNANELYSYNAYIRRRLGIDSSRDVEDLQLAGYFEDANDTQLGGTGFEARRKFFEGGKDFNTIAQLDVDFFKQPKLLLNNMKIQIELTPQSAPFILIGRDGSEYFAQPSNYKLYIKEHLLYPHVDNVINSNLAKKELAKYPYTRTLMNSYFIGGGRFDYKANLFHDMVPKRVFVALVDAKSFIGTKNTSPFEFKQFNLESIHVSVNNKIVPTYPYDLARNEYARPFKDLIDTTHKTGLTYEQYLSHSCIFAFDFQHYAVDSATEVQEQGNTALSIRFTKAVPVDGIQAIVYMEFESLMSFDYYRNITTVLPV